MPKFKSVMGVWMPVETTAMPVSVKPVEVPLEVTSEPTGEPVLKVEEKVSKEKKKKKSFFK